MAMTNEEKLWKAVFHGSPLAAALALTVLDKMYDGEISRILRPVEGKLRVQR